MKDKRVEKLMELGKVLGEEITLEHAIEVTRTADRLTAIRDSLNANLVKDHKKHIQVLPITHYDENGNRYHGFKFSYIDNPAYWTYVEGLVAKYCESLMEVKRTKTTLVVITA